MDHIRALFNSQRRLESRGGQLCKVIKVFASGCMVETAILFPLANIEALWFRCAVLSIFIIAALAFHALHLEPFIRFGPFTAPLALFILLLAVLPSASPRTELIPWLPLFIASFSLSTVAVDEVHKRLNSHSAPSVEDGLTDIPIGSWSYRSSQMETLSDEQSIRTLDDLNTIDTLLRGIHGPQLHYHPHQIADSDISLSDGSGRAPSDWDSTTRSFFPARNKGPSRPSPEQPQAGGHGRGNNPRNQDFHEASTAASLRSSDNLLGSQ